MEPAQRIIIHQISDLHRPATAANENTGTELYLQFLKKLPDDEKPNFIVICGDLGYKDGLDVVNAEKFLTDLCNVEEPLLLPHGYPLGSDTPSAERIRAMWLQVVPGNHDVCWDKWDKVDDKGKPLRLSAFEGLATTIGFLHPYKKAEDTKWHGIRHSRAVVEKGCIETLSGLAMYGYPSDAILFSSIDSTVRSGSLHEETQGQLLDLVKKYMKLKDAKDEAEIRKDMESVARMDPGYVPLKSLSEIAEGREKIETPDFPKVPLRIAILHHNVYPPYSEKVSRFGTFLNAGELLNVLCQNGFHIVLCGHCHSPAVRTHYDWGEPEIIHGNTDEGCSRHGLHIIGAGSLASPLESEHGFNVLEITRRGRDTCILKVLTYKAAAGRAFEHNPKETEFELDLLDAMDRDAIDRAKGCFEKVRPELKSNSKVCSVIDGFDELEQKVREQAEETRETVRSFREATRHMKCGRFWHQGLENISARLCAILRESCEKTSEKVDLFAVHGAAPHLWRTPELRTYLSQQLSGIEKGLIDVDRAFVIDKSSWQSPESKSYRQHLICAMDEQAFLGINVGGFFTDGYLEATKYAFESQEQPQGLCKLWDTNKGASTDWAFLRWKQNLAPGFGWRLLVMQRFAPKLSKQAESDLGGHIMRWLHLYAASEITSGASSRQTKMEAATLRDAVETATKRLKGKWWKHSIESWESSDLLNKMDPDGCILGKDKERRTKWLRCISEIQASTELKAVDICYSLVNFASLWKPNDGHEVVRRTVPDLAEGHDVWTDLLLRLWTEAHKRAVRNGGKCTRVFVLSDRYLAEMDSLWVLYDTLSRQFPLQDSSDASIRLLFLLDSDLIKSWSALRVMGLGNYLVAIHKDEKNVCRKYGWDYRGQEFSALDVLDSASEYRWSSANTTTQVDGAQIDRLEGDFLRVCKAVGPPELGKKSGSFKNGAALDDVIKKFDEYLVGKRLARNVSELFMCLAHLHGVATKRKESSAWQKVKNYKEYW
jgi:hypothetical protein